MNETGNERAIRAETVPTTADAFKSWGDRECGNWPGPLQKLAYETWQAMVEGREDAQAAFKASYERWIEQRYVSPDSNLLRTGGYQPRPSNSRPALPTTGTGIQRRS